MSYIDYETKLDETVQNLLQSAQSVFSDDLVISMMERIGGNFNITYREIGELCELVRQVITKELPIEKFETSLKEKLDEDNQPRVGEIVWEVNDKVFTKLLPALGMKALPIIPKPLPPAPPAPEPTSTAIPAKPITGAVPPYVPPLNPLSAGRATNVSNIGLAVPRPPYSSSAPTSNYRPPATPPTPPRVVPLTKIVPSTPPVQTSQQIPVARPTPSAVATPISAPQISKVPTFVTPVPIMPKPRPIIPPNLPTQNSQASPLNPLSAGRATETGRSGLASTSPLTTNNYKLPTSLVEPSHDQMSADPTNSFLKMLSGKLSEKELQMRFDRLPVALKNALRNVDSAKVVVDIGRKYALHIDKLGELGEETGLVILGITHPAQFLQRLVSHLGVNEEKAKQIGQEINTEVFLKIREALKQVNGGVARSVPSPSNSVPTPPPNPSTNEKLNREALLKNIEDPMIQLEPEQFPERDALLRDIENPAPANFTSVPIPVPSLNPLPAGRATEADSLGLASTPTAPSVIPKMPAPAVASPSIIEQKLSTTVTAPKSESKYTTDPYREQIS